MEISSALSTIYEPNNGAGIILGLGSPNDRRRCNVTLSPIDWAQTQNDPCGAVCWLKFLSAHGVGVVYFVLLWLYRKLLVVSY